MNVWEELQASTRAIMASMFHSLSSNESSCPPHNLNSPGIATVNKTSPVHPLRTGKKTRVRSGLDVRSLLDSVFDDLARASEDEHLCSEQWIH